MASNTVLRASIQLFAPNSPPTFPVRVHTEAEWVPQERPDLDVQVETDAYEIPQAHPLETNLTNIWVAARTQIGNIFGLRGQDLVVNELQEIRISWKYEYPVPDPITVSLSFRWNAQTRIAIEMRERATFTIPAGVSVEPDFQALRAALETQLGATFTGRGDTAVFAT